MKLSGKHAVVTGATGGLGRIITHRFIEEGAAVFLVGRNRSSLHAFQARMKSKGIGDIQSAVCDVRNSDEVEQLGNLTIDQNKRLPKLE